MGRTSHLSASATQIYPPSSSQSHSPSVSVSPPRSSHTTDPEGLHPEPLSTSDEHDRSNYDDTRARRIRILDVARLALTVFGVAAAAAVVGCEAHTLSVYNFTRLDEEFFLPPLWPAGLDLRPSHGMVVGGSMAVLMGLVYVLVGVVPVVSCVPSRKHSNSGEDMYMVTDTFRLMSSLPISTSSQSSSQHPSPYSD